MCRNVIRRFEVLEDRALLSADFSRAALFASSHAASANQPSAEIAPAQDAAIAQGIASKGASTQTGVSPQPADAVFAQQAPTTVAATAQPNNQSMPMGASSGAAGGWVNPDYFRERFGKEAGPEPARDGSNSF